MMPAQSAPSYGGTTTITFYSPKPDSAPHSDDRAADRASAGCRKNSRRLRFGAGEVVLGLMQLVLLSFFVMALVATALDIYSQFSPF